MKVLYQYLDGVYSYCPEEPERDTSMEFDSSF